MKNLSWDSNVCSHAGECVKGLPQVFRVEDGQFVIDQSAAEQAEIERVVALCPSGALTFND